MGSTQVKRHLQVPNESFFLFGPRGTGKSSWIEVNFPDAALNITLLDEALFLAYASDPGLIGRQLSQLKKGSWVIIDEVQRLPVLLNAVHLAIEQYKIRFVLCGSSARKLRKKGVNLLGGRALESHMHPFTALELVSDFDLNEHLEFGSLPILLQSSDKKKKLLAYVQTYLAQEIQRESAVKRLPSFVKFLRVAALFHAQVINISSLARDAGVARSTIQGYLEILQDSLMVFFLEAYRPKLRVKEVAHPKLYWFDPGVVRAIKKNLGPVIPEESGALFEGWVAQLLRAQNDYRGLYDEISYWSSHEGGQQRVEVDFLLRRGRELIAIEAKASEHIKPEFFKGLRAIAELKDVKRRILVYRGSETQRSDGIEIMSPSAFLEFLRK